MCGTPGTRLRPYVNVQSTVGQSQSLPLHSAAFRPIRSERGKLKSFTSLVSTNHNMSATTMNVEGAFYTTLPHFYVQCDHIIVHFVALSTSALCNPVDPSAWSWPSKLTDVDPNSRPLTTPRKQSTPRREPNCTCSSMSNRYISYPFFIFVSQLLKSIFPRSSSMVASSRTPGMMR
jgi:hypothetical protein